MENQDKKGIKLIFVFENKKVAMRVENPMQSIKITIENIKKEARNNPEKLWYLPEMDAGGNIIRYYLGRKNDNGKNEILKEKNSQGEEQSLFDYGVREGDILIIVKKVIAGGGNASLTQCSEKQEEKHLLKRLKERLLSVINSYPTSSMTSKDTSDFKKCPNGHWYLKSKGECPFCPQTKADKGVSKEPTVPYENTRSGSRKTGFVEDYDSYRPTGMNDDPNDEQPQIRYTRKIDNKEYDKTEIIRERKKHTQLSLFAPSQLARGEKMLVQVYFHSEKLFEKISSKAFMRDKNSTLRAKENLTAPLQYDDTVEIKLIMPKGIQVDEPIQKIVWEDDMKTIDFVVSVPSFYQLGDMIGTVIVCKNSLPICSVKFVTRIVSQVEDNVPNAKTYPIYYKKVFVSYSSADREEVVKITTGFRVLHIDFFLDKLYLEGGDKYKDKIFEYINKADLFLLCWSLNAAQSEWVKKEYLYALERISRPDMALSIYPIIIEPKVAPPEELDDYHFVEL